MTVQVINYQPGEWWGTFELGGLTHNLGPYSGRWEATEAAARRRGALLAESKRLERGATLAAKVERRKRSRQSQRIERPRTRPQTETLGAREQRVGYRGVVPEGGGYIVKFKYQGERLYFGWFKCKEEAARVYDEQMLRLRGAGALLNFPRAEFLGT